MHNVPDDPQPVAPMDDIADDFDLDTPEQAARHA